MFEIEDYVIYSLQEVIEIIIIFGDVGKRWPSNNKWSKIQGVLEIYVAETSNYLRTVAEQAEALNMHKCHPSKRTLIYISSKWKFILFQWYMILWHRKLADSQEDSMWTGILTNFI